MSGDSQTLSLKKDSTLWDVEDAITEAEKKINTVNLKIPRNHKMRFFKDSWISTLIATASQKNLVITDWHHLENEKEIKDRFSNSLIGITSVFLANGITNTKHTKIQIDIDAIVEQVAYDQEGMIEDHESGKSFVFCSFDSNDKNNYPRPFALSVSSKQDFIHKFLQFKMQKIDRSNQEQLSFIENITTLPSLIYELYENTFHHGRYDEHNNKIKGVRSFSIKRHTSYNKDSLIEQAQTFSELENYINELSIIKKRNLNFYEISISDNGIGIINRFLSTRSDMKDDEAFNGLSKLEKLNRIISDSLSSKLYPGSGLGLSIALKNILELKGFVSLRTEDFWVYFDGSKESGTLSFKETNNSNLLSEIRGTHYNILIPIT